MTRNPISVAIIISLLLLLLGVPGLMLVRQAEVQRASKAVPVRYITTETIDQSGNDQ